MSEEIAFPASVAWTNDRPTHLVSIFAQRDSMPCRFCSSTAFVGGGGPRRHDHRRLPRRAQPCPRDVPGAGPDGLRCLNGRQVRLDQCLQIAGSALHPRLRSVTGLEVLFLGRLRGRVNAGRHPAGRDARAARMAGPARGGGRGLRTPTAGLRLDRPRSPSSRWQPPGRLPRPTPRADLGATALRQSMQH